ncbi:MAG: hypothetical protein LBC20_01990 [Planctomycetaceae bacterium]|nr:hypothetical protein [Planctomycetaceae bacterium]
MFTFGNYKVGDLSPKGRTSWFCYGVVHGWFLISVRQQGQVGYRRPTVGENPSLPARLPGSGQK